MRALWSSCFPEEKDREFIPVHFSVTWLVQHKYYKGNFVYCRFYSLIFKGNSEMTHFSLCYKKKTTLQHHFSFSHTYRGLVCPLSVGFFFFWGNGKKIRKLFLHLSLLNGRDTLQASSPIRLASKTSRGRTHEQAANPRPSLSRFLSRANRAWLLVMSPKWRACSVAMAVMQNLYSKVQVGLCLDCFHVFNWHFLSHGKDYKHGEYGLTRMTAVTWAFYLIVVWRKHISKPLLQ